MRRDAGAEIDVVGCAYARMRGFRGDLVDVPEDAVWVPSVVEHGKVAFRIVAIKAYVPVALARGVVQNPRCDFAHRAESPV